MTINDLELNELLVISAQLIPRVTQYVNDGHLGMALTESAKLEDAVRKMGWRILELTGKGDSI